jgi:hypothetical protein
VTVSVHYQEEVFEGDVNKALLTPLLFFVVSAAVKSVRALFDKGLD